MKLKEKRSSAETGRAAESGRGAGITLGPASALFLSAFFGFLAAGARLGGNGAPLCAAMSAALPAFSGLAAFAGSLASFFLDGSFSSRVTELIAMPAIIFARAMVTSVFGRKLTPKAACGLAGAGYIICGLIAAMAYKITAALILAIFFRGLICGTAAYFSAKLFAAAADGSVASVKSRLSLAVVYALVLCMLCGISLGAFNAGRAVGAFVILAAAFRYGCTGGAAVGALSAFAFGMTSPSMAYTAVIAVCSGAVSGFFSKKNKLSAAAAFIGSAFAGALIYGMPSDAAKLIADMTAAAAAFYIVPEKFYSRPFGRTSAPVSAAAVNSSDGLKFAASAVADVRESFAKAAEVLEKGDPENDISAAVCGKVCVSCRNGAFCGDSPEHRREAFFRPAEGILKRKGFIGGKDFSDALDHCPKKEALAVTFNEMYRLSQIEKRYGSENGSMRELALEHLTETEDMLNYLGGGAETFLSCDENLSEHILSVLKRFGAKKPSAAALFDKEGRLYIECFYRGVLSERTDTLAERLCEISDRELDKPSSLTLDGVTHLRFHELPVYEAEIGKANVSGRENVSGDSDAVFRDGLGNLCVLLSDGMGSGVRAAVESRMTVSVMTRLLRAGIGSSAAVRMLNGLLITKSPEEIFATVDLLKINLFTGKAELVKLGAAQTFLKTNGTVKTVESRTTPVGIVGSCEIDKRTAQLSDGDQIVMITDGICEECFPRVRELMLSMGVTAQDCAERIVAEAEKNKEENLSKQDDKTVYVVKIHKI
ncbi:MAG: SpoIIE family protein phosphatase [Ruminococcus sp.]|nr:SpoIIE family protein phosphatase [Ruminococcus sp.]